MFSIRSVACFLVAGCSWSSISMGAGRCDLGVVDAALAPDRHAHPYDTAMRIVAALGDACGVPILAAATGDQPPGDRSFVAATLEAPSAWNAICPAGTDVLLEVAPMYDDERWRHLVEACALERFGIDAATLQGWGPEAFLRTQAVGTAQALPKPRRRAIVETLREPVPKGQLVISGLEVEAPQGDADKRVIARLRWSAHGWPAEGRAGDVSVHATCKLAGQPWTDVAFLTRHHRGDRDRGRKGLVFGFTDEPPPSLSWERPTTCAFTVVAAVMQSEDPLRPDYRRETVATFCWTGGGAATPGSCDWRTTPPEGDVAFSLVEHAPVEKSQTVRAWFEATAGTGPIAPGVRGLVVTCDTAGDASSLFFSGVTGMLPGDRRWFSATVMRPTPSRYEWPLGCTATLQRQVKGQDPEALAAWCLSEEGFTPGACP